MPAAAHWNTRAMAKASGSSVSTMHRIWRAFSLQPHRSDTFKLSTEPLFVDKVRYIVGLYLSPPDQALARGTSCPAALQKSIVCFLENHNATRRPPALHIGLEDPHDLIEGKER